MLEHSFEYVNSFTLPAHAAGQSRHRSI